MLCRWILDSGQILKQHKWIGVVKYCTQTAAIESVLRSEMKRPKEVIAKLLKKNKFLLQVRPDEMKKSLQRLKRLNFDASDIRIHPSVLLQSEFQLLNNFQRLHELGYSNVTIYRLANIKDILTKSVQFNQSFNFLPKNINVIENIFTVAKVPLKSDIDTNYDRQMRLEAIHRQALRSYMLNRIKYTSADIDEMWIYYPGLKTRSLQSIDRSRQLLEDAYKVPVSQLPRFILLMQPEEIEELLAVDIVSGINVKQVMTIAAKCNLKRIREIEVICANYKVPDYAIAFAPKIFFMNVDTLSSRINRICKLKHGKDFLQHVAIGKVIVNMGLIEIYAKQHKKRFDSVFSDTFVNFCLNGFITRKNRPLLFYLCKVFNKSKDEINEALQIHPHSSMFSFPVVHENIEYLLNKGFTHDDIFQDLPIILYSIDEIKEFFDRLKDPVETARLNINPEQLSKSELLRLCVYTIEKKSGFNGEGIYLNSRAAEFNDDESWEMEEMVKQISCWS
ncbi:uncharacterized protein LOC129571238 [Sitodiplosis mosellana]|uniref:uncharacterized protein LOC129571238 n=1 Tax=Sitodiplosis mosellana TaxID=263140 RepID=UPI0024447E0D|nr:uncharacterized protein LOC129571238 [Sitodiplosis mosellana]